MGVERRNDGCREEKKEVRRRERRGTGKKRGGEEAISPPMHIYYIQTMNESCIHNFLISKLYEKISI